MILDFFLFFLGIMLLMLECEFLCFFLALWVSIFEHFAIKQAIKLGINEIFVLYLGMEGFICLCFALVIFILFLLLFFWESLYLNLLFKVQ